MHKYNLDNIQTPAGIYSSSVIKLALSLSKGKDKESQKKSHILCVCVACLSHLIASCEGVIHMMMIYSGPSVQWRGLNYYDNYHQNI